LPAEDAGMNNPAQPHHGVILVLLAASLWGTTGTAQGLGGGALAPVWIGALRLAVAAAFFAAMAGLATASRPPAETRSDGRTWLVCIGAGLCMATYNLAFFAGIRLTGVALGTAVALGSGPLWAGVLQALVQSSWPTPAWWFGTALAVTGGVLMARVGGAASAQASVAGLMLCALAGLSYAVYTLLIKQVAATTPATTVTLRAFAVAAAVALPLAATSSGLPIVFSWHETATVLYLGLLATGVPYLLFSLALRHISAAAGVTLALFEPVTACLLAAAVLGEVVTTTAWTGLGLVLGGVLLVVRSELSTPADRPAGMVA
jgi:drug/metabolite transporter, DME family